MMSFANAKEMTPEDYKADRARERSEARKIIQDSIKRMILSPERQKCWDQYNTLEMEDTFAGKDLVSKCGMKKLFRDVKV